MATIPPGECPNFLQPDICITTPRYRQAPLVRYTNFRAESIRQRIKYGTVHFLRVAVAPLDLRWKDYEMRKGFTRKPKADEPTTQGKNYITPSGLQRLQDEHQFLLSRERLAVT